MAPGARNERASGVQQREDSGLLDAVGRLGPQRLLLLTGLDLLAGEDSRSGGKGDENELLHGGPLRGSLREVAGGPNWT